MVVNVFQFQFNIQFYSSHYQITCIIYLCYLSHYPGFKLQISFNFLQRLTPLFHDIIIVIRFSINQKQFKHSTDYIQLQSIRIQIYNPQNLKSKNKNPSMFSKLINKGYEAEQCQICKSQFSILKFQRIHKCKRCNKYVCWKCGDHKQRVMDEEGQWSTEPHRVCNPCNTELTRIYKLVEEKKMRWGQKSLVSQQWLNRMASINPSKKAKRQKDYQYQHFLKLFHENPKNFEQQCQIIDKDVIKGRTDYLVFNFSLRQFFYIVQDGGDLDKTRRNIANVLYAVAARFDQIGYVQGMSSIAAFLLCFCNQESAYTIFCDLIENVFPEKFLVRGNYGVNLIGLLAQIHFLKQYFIHIITVIKKPLISHFQQQYTKQQIQHYRMIVELSASKSLISLFVNVLSYSHIEFVWKQLSMHRNFEVIQRAFLATMYLKRNHLIQRRSFKELETMFEHIDYQEFIEAYYDLDIDANIKAKLIEEYYQSLNKKWSNNSQHNIKQLHRCTNFTQEEIKLLQKKFLVRSQINDKQKQEKGVITKQEFILLIRCYYDILKQNQQSQAPILEITQFFVSKIFDSFITKKSANSQISLKNDIKQRSQYANSSVVSQNQQKTAPSKTERIKLSVSSNSFQKQLNQTQNQKKPSTRSCLDFRQFVCCFSLCTKGLLKDRMCAIVNTFEDRNKKITFNSFSKLVKNLCDISPPDIQDKKKAFIERMNRYFNNQQSGISINELYILLNDTFINQLTVYIRSDAPNIISNTLDLYFKRIASKGSPESSNK